MSDETATTDAGPTEEQLIASLGAPEEGEVRSEAPVIEQEEQQDEPEIIVPPELDEPPEFWSAERKALWAKIADPDVRAAIRGHVEDISKGTSKKLEEAAIARKQAEDSAKAALANQEQLAEWWKAKGQSIADIVRGRWAGVDWNKLSAENPAEWARLRQAYENEQAVVRETTERHQAEIRKVEERRKTAHQEERRTEHQKLAAKFPKEFGSSEAAQKTYDALSGFLVEMGIPGDRVSGVYEAPIVEIVKMAYELKQLQAKAKGITTQRQAAQPASTTPRRIEPGAARPANRGTDDERQALERLRNGESTEDVLRLAFR